MKKQGVKQCTYAISMVCMHACIPAYSFSHSTKCKFFVPDVVLDIKSSEIEKVYPGPYGNSTSSKVCKYQTKQSRNLWNLVGKGAHFYTHRDEHFQGTFL